MSSPQLDSAIGVLEAEIQGLGSATLKGGQPPTSLWYLLQAKSLGLSLLRTLNQHNITDPVAVNLFRSEFRKNLVQPPEESSAAPG